jgi:cytochrome c oxidase assembly protein subunit 15
VPRIAPIDDAGLRRRFVVLAALVYAQILLGATMRHMGGGLAIPDFPLSYGHVIPPFWNVPIALHFAHRVGALTVTVLVLMNVTAIWRRYRDHVELMRPAGILLLAVGAQVTLGAFVVLTGKQPIVNTLHVATGAIVLGTSLLLALRIWRVRFEASGAAEVWRFDVEPRAVALQKPVVR